jgi:hypothetical protein
LANGDAYFEQIADTFLLFGDPATELKVPLPHIPTWIGAKRQKGGAQLRWNESVDCNGNAVAGYNIYHAQSAAGPFSKINSELVTDTIFIDTQVGVGMTSGSGVGAGSYYRVSAVDDGGVESAQSLSISPAALTSGSSSGGGGGGGGGAGCFITTAQDTSSPKSSWVLFTIAAVLCIGRSRRMRDFMS